LVTALKRVTCCNEKLCDRNDSPRDSFRWLISLISGKQAENLSHIPQFGATFFEYHLLYLLCKCDYLMAAKFENSLA
jgi:hypothetical protein